VLDFMVVDDCIDMIDTYCDTFKELILAEVAKRRKILADDDTSLNELDAVMDQLDMAETALNRLVMDHSFIMSIFRR